MRDIFKLDVVATGVMPTREVWVGSKEEFYKKYVARADNCSINYGAPIPAFMLDDAAGLLPSIKKERWPIFAKLMLRRYGIDIMSSELLPKLQARNDVKWA